MEIGEKQLEVLWASLTMETASISLEELESTHHVGAPMSAKGSPSQAINRHIQGTVHEFSHVSSDQCAL